MAPKSDWADTSESIDKSAERNNATAANARLRESVEWESSAGGTAALMGTVKSLLDGTRLELTSASAKSSAAEQQPLTEGQKQAREREVREELDRMYGETRGEPIDVWALKEDAPAAREIVAAWLRENRNRFAKVEIHEADATTYDFFKWKGKGYYYNLNGTRLVLFPTIEDTRNMSINRPMVHSSMQR